MNLGKTLRSFENQAPGIYSILSNNTAKPLYTVHKTVANGNSLKRKEQEHR